MTQLKTLKDLGVLKEAYDENSDDWFVSTKDLKQEAIKWIKSGELNNDDWKEFFQLTEEDLE